MHMAAFVVLSPAVSDAVENAGTRVNIFPGSVTQSVLPAGEPFWIGYGFVPEPSDADPEARWASDDETRFELLLDGEPVPLATDLRVENGRTVSKLSVARFRSGLPLGWHRLSGRWYEGGALVLTNDRSIEFVEP
jgi:hypothetical protein